MANNKVVGTYVSNEPEAVAYREGLVARLNVYENAFDAYFEKNKNATESLAHRNAMYDAGLTDQGLITARVYAGKKASAKPGVFIPISEYRPVS
jgi:hypothetical protein